MDETPKVPNATLFKTDGSNYYAFLPDGRRLMVAAAPAVLIECSPASMHLQPEEGHQTATRGAFELAWNRGAQAATDAARFALPPLSFEEAPLTPAA